MTNEEKAREIGEFFETTYLAALEAAEWKDQQIKKYLEKKKADIYWDEPSLIDRNTKLDILKEIINELFPE